VGFGIDVDGRVPQQPPHHRRPPVVAGMEGIAPSLRGRTDPAGPRGGVGAPTEWMVFMAALVKNVRLVDGGDFVREDGLTEGMWSVVGESKVSLL